METGGLVFTSVILNKLCAYLCDSLKVPKGAESELIQTAVNLTNDLFVSNLEEHKCIFPFL